MWRTGQWNPLYGLGPFIITSRSGAMVVNGRQSDGCTFARMCTTEGFKCSEVQYNDLALRGNANIVRTCPLNLEAGTMKTFITHQGVYSNPL